MADSQPQQQYQQPQDPASEQRQQDPSQEQDPPELSQSLDEAIEERLKSKPQPPAPPKEEKREVPQVKASVMASLHRREQQLQQRMSEFAKREASVAEREAIFQNGKHSPFEALKLIGYDNPNDFLDTIAKTGGEWTPEQKKLHELEKKYAEAERREQQRQLEAEEESHTQQQRQLIDNWHNDIAKYVRGSAEYKETLVALPGTEKAVFQVIQDHYREHGERMEFADACNTVNAQMEDELKQACQSIGSSPRGRQLIQEYVASLSPQTPKRGKSTAQPNMQAVRPESRSDPLEEMDLNDALEATIAQRRAAQRR